MKIEIDADRVRQIAEEELRKLVRERLTVQLQAQEPVQEPAQEVAQGPVQETAPRDDLALAQEQVRRKRSEVPAERGQMWWSREEDARLPVLLSALPEPDPQFAERDRAENARKLADQMGRSPKSVKDRARYLLGPDSALVGRIIRSRLTQP